MEPGRQFGTYTIHSLLGAGGMGEVYRARDTRLGRDVALKVLSASFTGDADRMNRFEREALLLASLNHPNIAIIHGLEEAGGIRALVLELIEGPTLAERIAQGPIALRDTLALARQIADALQSAHDHGVIHRDLKPANIKVRRDGTVKVLDFGLAKLTGELTGTGADARLASSPTMVESMPGLLLGTAAYMSPEQAKGQEADRRSDVWAFGCVLFEMLTALAAFGGASSTEVFANVLKTDPDWSRLPAGTPDSIRRLLRRCLEKDDRRRVWDIADARLELDEARDELLATRPAATTPVRGKERLAWAAAVIVLALLAVAIGVRAVRPAPPPAPEVRFDITTPPASESNELVSIALAPDARNLVYVANSGGQRFLWLRPFDSVAPRPLAGTADALFPFWKPDSRSVAFFADGVLKRLDLDGGLVRTLTKATVGLGGAWNREGTILFVPNPASAILRVAEDGGAPSEATRLEAGHAGHATPVFLPDGHHFLYFVTANPESRGIYVGQLDGSPPRKLFDADAAAVYTDGYLLFVRQANLFAQAFDAERLELKGSPFQVADTVQLGNWGGLSALSAAARRVIAFRAGAASFARQFEWVNRSGGRIGTVGDASSAYPDGISPSPDGSQLVLFRRGDSSSDLWILETRRGVQSRFTSDPAEDIFPIWSRDGSRIIFSSNRSGQFALYQKRPSGNDAEELLLTPHAEETFATDTSADGQWLLYQRRSVKTGWDIWALPLRGERTPLAVIQTEADEGDGLLSSDGRWLAYVANKSGSFQLYVQPFPGAGPGLQVSTKGAVQARWGPDARELFYIGFDGTMMAVPMEVAANGQSINPGTPTPLFATRVGRTLVPGPNSGFVVSADGQRFLMNTVVPEGGAVPLRVILNWKAGS
jgi:Tol biopolymer transport system component